MTHRDASNVAVVLEGGLTGLADAMFDELPEAVICADCGGLIRFWNSGAERTFGFLRDEAVGKSIEIIIPEGLRQRHRDTYPLILETGRSPHPSYEPRSMRAQTKSGQTISVHFTVALLPGPYGLVAGIAAVLCDTTGTIRDLTRPGPDESKM